MVKNRKHIIAIVIVCIFLCACGYRFSGSGNLPNGVRSINIQILENRTAETGVETIFTNDLIYEFTRKKKAVLTSSEKADAILTGVIVSLRTEGIAHKGQHTSLERRIEAIVNLKLTNSDGGAIWSATGVSENQAYSVTSDKEETERNKRVAIEVVSKKIAEKIYNSLTDDF